MYLQRNDKSISLAVTLLSNNISMSCLTIVLPNYEGNHSNSYYADCNDLSAKTLFKT